MHYSVAERCRLMAYMLCNLCHCFHIFYIFCTTAVLPQRKNLLSLLFSFLLSLSLSSPTLFSLALLLLLVVRSKTISPGSAQTPLAAKREEPVLRTVTSWLPTLCVGINISFSFYTAFYDQQSVAHSVQCTV